VLRLDQRIKMTENWLSVTQEMEGGYGFEAGGYPKLLGPSLQRLPTVTAIESLFISTRNVGVAVER